MIAGYHTAGLLLHDCCIVIGELAHLGYSCVAIRPHPMSLNPDSPDFSERIVRLVDTCKRHHLRAVLDLDAPYFHDPWREHGPSLASADESQRELAFQWVTRWIDVAVELQADLISFASGESSSGDGDPPEQELERLASQLERLSDAADSSHVRLALRPRHGDVIATVAQFERLGQWIGADSEIGLAADVGEMLLGGELPVADRLARNLDALACVYLCDRKAGVSGDRPIGHGDVALIRILRSLKEHQYKGPAIVRVEGHSELGLSVAREAIELFDD